MLQFEELEELETVFEPLLRRMFGVMLERFRHYGSQNIHDQGIAGITARLRDKLARIEHMERAGEGEKASGDWIDLCNYALIGFAKHSGTWPIEESLPTAAEYEAMAKANEPPPRKGFPIDAGRLPQETANDLPLGLERRLHPRYQVDQPHNDGRGRLIYLASSYDFGKIEGRRAIAVVLAARGWSVFSPCDAFFHSGPADLPDITAAAIIKVNQVALSNCQALVLLVDPDRFSFGSVQEAIEVHSAGKPVVLLCERQPGIYARHLLWAKDAEQASHLLAERLEGKD